MFFALRRRDLKREKMQLRTRRCVFNVIKNRIRRNVAWCEPMNTYILSLFIHNAFWCICCCICEDIFELYPNVILAHKYLFHNAEMFLIDDCNSIANGKIISAFVIVLMIPEPFYIIGLDLEKYLWFFSSFLCVAIRGSRYVSVISSLSCYCSHNNSLRKKFVLFYQA